MLLGGAEFRVVLPLEPLAAADARIAEVYGLSLDRTWALGPSKG